MIKPVEIEQWLEDLVQSHTPANSTVEQRILTLAKMCQKLRAELKYYGLAERLVITHSLANNNSSLRVKTEKVENGNRARQALEYFPDGVL